MVATGLTTYDKCRRAFQPFMYVAVVIDRHAYGEYESIYVILNGITI
jgi:hypothetical protein